MATSSAPFIPEERFCCISSPGLTHLASRVGDMAPALLQTLTLLRGTAVSTEVTDFQKVPAATAKTLWFFLCPQQSSSQAFNAYLLGKKCSAPLIHHLFTFLSLWFGYSSLPAVDWIAQRSKLTPSFRTGREVGHKLFHRSFCTENSAF